MLLSQAFHLTGGILITLPEDRLSDEMEQLVLSTKHLHSLLDDFVLRQPTRRVLKVSCCSPRTSTDVSGCRTVVEKIPLAHQCRTDELPYHETLTFAEEL